MRDLQVRLQNSLGPLPSTARGLYEDLGRVWGRAVLDEGLQNGEYGVSNLLRISQGTPTANGMVFVLTGGPKDFDRVSGALSPKERLVREDAAVIHFSLTVLERAGSIELLAYDFEIYFPSGEPISFLRFDLNRRGHDNEELGIRSHIHPGHGDLQLPSPTMTPVRTLTSFIYRGRPRRAVGPNRPAW